MKRIITVFFVALAFLSCGRSVSEEDLSKLNGYWEIEEAIMADGSKKEYTINSTIDFFKVKGKEGIRKKVMPQFDGTYRVNDLSETIKIVMKDNKTYLDYTTEYAKWREEIIELDNEELVLKNQHDIEYHYKRPQPFSVK